MRINGYFGRWIIWIGLLFIQKTAFTQDYHVWRYFGQTIDFHTEPPSYSAVYKDVGYCNASICDRQGNLLIYSEDDPMVRFYDKTGTETALTGNRSPQGHQTINRYKAGLIRLNDSIVAYFQNAGIGEWWTDYYRDSNGMYMTLINTNLNSGSGGIVPGYNDVRINPLPHGGITFRMNSDSTWWIISESRDCLLAYKLLRNGTILPPVVTFLSELDIARDTVTVNPQISSMRFSNDGNFFVHGSHWEMKTTNDEQSSIFAYSFNEMTGVFSNQVLIEKAMILNGSGDFFWCEDIVFSPNDSLFYLLYSNHKSDKNIVQLERYNPSIASTEYVVSYIQASELAYNAELGQNGKIYLSASGTDFYSVIYRPNLRKDKCTFLPGSFYRRDNVSCPPYIPNCYYYFLQNFPYSRYHGYKMNFDYRMNCDSSLQILNCSDTTALTNFSWYLYGPNSYLDSSSAVNPVFTPPVSGYYWLKFKGTTKSGYQPWFSDSVYVEFLDIPEAGFVLSSNEGCQYVGFLIEDASSKKVVHPTEGESWSWNFGDGSDTLIVSGNSGDIIHTYDKTGSFIITLSYSNGYCNDSFSYTSTVTIEDAPKPGVSVDNTVGCYPFNAVFNDRYSDPIDSVVMDFGDGNRFSSTLHLKGHLHVYLNTGLYTAVQYLYGASGCVSVDSVKINVLKGFLPGEQLELAYTTLAGTHIETHWLGLDEAMYYELERADDESTSWKRIYAGKDTVFEDQDILPWMRYKYRVTAVDTCNRKLVSNQGSNLVLSGTNIENSLCMLTWNPYTIWRSGIREYNLIKIDPNTGSPNSLVETTANNVTDFGFYATEADSVCYQVIATSNSNPDWRSTSNMACVRFSPAIWIPNSFSPNNNNLNEVFKPVIVGVRNENYEFVIYNRWGSVIFQTTSKEEGWNGTFKSSPAPPGVYFYRLSYAVMDLDGKYSRLNATGNVILLR